MAEKPRLDTARMTANCLYFIEFFLKIVKVCEFALYQIRNDCLLKSTSNSHYPSLTGGNFAYCRMVKISLADVMQDLDASLIWNSLCLKHRRE
jgi:hypothetical protein